MELRNWYDRGSFFRFYEHEIFYRDEGVGPTIILLHGFPTSSWDWHKVWPALTKNFRVIAPDFLGYGFSSKPKKSKYTIALQADLVEELISELDLTEVHILAHDYGDTVAQELLFRYNDRPNGAYPIIKSLCLLNGGLFPESHQPRFIQKLLFSPLGGLLTHFLTKKNLRDNLRNIAGKDTKPTEEEIDNFWKLIKYNKGIRISHKLVRYMQERIANRPRWVGALQQTKVPLRLINGGADPISGKHMAKRFEKLINQPDVVLMDSIGHYPQMEAPDLVLEHYLRFLDSLQKNKKLTHA